MLLCVFIVKHLNQNLIFPFNFKNIANLILKLEGD